MTTTSSTTSTTPTTAGTGSSIINTLGTGSGIDSSSIVTKLVEINKLPESTRLTTKQTLLESQVSDFGLLRSAFSTLETAAAALGNADTFNAKSTSIPTTNLLGITKLDAKAVAGEYRIKVDSIAQTQSLSSKDFTSQTAPIGKGTLAIRFGTWTNVDDNAVPPVLKDFTVDATKTGTTITIDDGNNSLVGLRDAINKAGIGVNASIVSNNGTYKLLVTAPSGASSEIEITATETPGSLGLADFNVNQNDRKLTQQQDGRDAQIRVNGIALSRSSNHLTDVIDGLEFDLFNASTTETVNIGITEDKTIAEKAIRDFVAAYNTFLKDSGKLVGFDSEKNGYGSLHQDPLAKSLLQQVRGQIGSTITGLTNNGFTSLATLGIRTQLDGTLSIDENSSLTTSFRSAIDKHFESVRDLFVPQKTSNNAQLTLTNYSAKSVAGSYDVVITQQPTKGTLVAGAMTAFDTPPLDTTGKDYTFTVNVDGNEASPITLPVASYASGAALAADLQTRINSDAKLLEAKVSLTVNYNTTTKQLEFTSNAYGSDSKISFSNLSADMADMGIDAGHSSGTTGVDVAGTVGGIAAFGSGDVLLPALGSKAEGLSMRVEPGVTSGTITFSRGFSGTFTTLIDDFLKSSGMIKNRESNISKEVEKVKDDMKTLDRRSEAYRARLQAQFSAMETIVRGLKSTGDFLTSTFAALNGTNES